MTDSYENLIKNRQISEDYVLNTKIRVGFLPQEFDNFYFENYFMGFPFYRNIKERGISVVPDG